MNGFIIFLIVIASLFLVSLIKIQITTVYKTELKMYISVLFLRITVTPRKARTGPYSISLRKSRKIKDRRTKKSEKKKARALEKKQMKSERKQEGTVSTVSFLLKNLDIATLFMEKVMKKFSRHIRIKVARLRIKIATGDAASTAVAYGAACAGANVLLAVLASSKQFYRFRNSDIDISADYLSDTPEFDLKISLSVRVWQLLDFAFTALARLISFKFRMMKHADEQKKPNRETK